MYSERLPAAHDPGMPFPQNLYRGLYVRIASRLNVDPSYVSRVARGERRSHDVEIALRHELDEISRKLGSGFTNGAEGRTPRSGKPLTFFVKKNRTWIRQQWLVQSNSDRGIRQFKLASQKRAAPVLSLIDESLKLARLSPSNLATAPRKAADRHGELRRKQGYTPTALLEEYNLLRRCIFAVAQKHWNQLDVSRALHDVSQLNEALDLQTQSAIQSFLADGQHTSSAAA